MRCRWCSGTGQRTEYNRGCEHCNDTGRQADPPFGDARSPESWISEHAINEIARVLTDPNRAWAAVSRNISYLESKGVLVRMISNLVCGEQLPDSEVDRYAAYWADSTCGDNYGDMIIRIANRHHFHMFGGRK
jgi:hypothetical protein